MSAHWINLQKKLQMYWCSAVVIESALVRALAEFP